MLRLLHKVTMTWAVKTQLNMDRLSPDSLRELQWKKLRALLDVAYERTPFYRRRFEEMGATPDDIRKPEDYARIPLLTREDVLNHAGEMLVRPGGDLRRGRSGGTTAAPLTFYFDHDGKYYRQALGHRLHAWAGASRLRPAMLLWGEPIGHDAPKDIRPWHRWLKPSFRYRVTSLAEDSLAALARDLIRIRPRLVFGYASILLALARHLAERGTVVPPPRAVVSTAETLYPESRAIIEAGFHAPVYNLYGATETHYFAGECPSRLGLHVVLDHVFLEIQTAGGPVKHGEPGQLIVTDLDNSAMPFLRYRLNDVGAWSDQECSCGRSLPLLSVYGRHTEFVRARDGQVYWGFQLSPALLPRLGDGGLRQCQLRQEVPGHVLVALVKGLQATPTLEDDLRQTMEAVFRGGMVIDFDWVERIPAEPSGKTPFIKSAVPFDAV